MSEQAKGKLVSESAIHDQTAVVFPNDLNAIGTLFGGRLLEQADRVAAVVAHRHSGRACVTLGVDSVRFHAPAHHGDILVFRSAVNRVWNSSMEVGLKVFVEDFKTLHLKHICSAYFTFVALGDDGKPVGICPAIPETADERRRYLAAEQRRQVRLKNMK